VTETRFTAGRRALAAALLTVLLWASAFVGIRSAGHHFGPGALALLRLLVASAALTALYLRRREPFPRGRDLWLIVGCGVLWLGLYNVVLNAAERSVDAGTAAMLVNTGPIMIAVLAGVFLGEGFPKRLLIGIAVAFVGSVVIGIATSSQSSSAGWGAALCVLAALSYACGVIFQKPVLGRRSSLQVTWLACLVGTLFCLPFAGQLWRQAGDAPAQSLLWVVYLGIFPTAVGFVAWGYALSRTTAGRMGSVTYLVPPVAILLGWAILSEVPPWLAVGGGALCLAGVVYARGVGSGRSAAQAPAAAPVVHPAAAAPAHEPAAGA
jgi:drug/metabolite transporter (DMT)-like permease